MEEGGDGMAKYARMVLEFIKKDVFEDRKQVSVEEVVTLIAALTDISVVCCHGSGRIRWTLRRRPRWDGTFSSTWSDD